MKVVALDTFRADGQTRSAGDEFDVSDNRGKELTERGLVRAATGSKAESRAKNKAEPTLANKAADAGPLSSVGGRTGGAERVSSSAAAPQRVKPTSAKRSRSRK